MLKKIVKYGNSSALVLDKALLELLNMGEGSVVKIRTDGVSLIITPQAPQISEKISPTLTVEDAWSDAITKAQAPSFEGDREKASAYREGVKEISERYDAMMRGKKNLPEVQRAVEEIRQRFANDVANPQYTEQLAKVYQEYIPEIKGMQQELLVLQQKYCPKSATDMEQMSLSVAEFGKVHTQYQHVLRAMANLSQNPDYIHEMMLLAETYKESVNSKEHLDACLQLVVKYIPEYAAYQAELKQAGERFYKTP